MVEDGVVGSSSLSVSPQMDPDELPSASSLCDSDKKNLELLLQTFGSVISLEDIASAYGQSGHNLYDTCDILYSLQRSTSKLSTLSSEEDLESPKLSSVCSSDNSLEMSEATKSKPRKSSASLGTVSGVIGKGYVKPKVTTNESFKPKPVKLNSDEFPASELWNEKDIRNSTSSSDTMQLDTEEFLFKLLGEGFSLDKSVIRDIVGQCGYDVTKSMDKLLDLSASKLEKSDDILEVSFETPMNENSKMGLVRYEEPLQYTSSGSLKHNLKTRSMRQLPDINKTYDLEKEVLDALFTVSVSERSEEESKKCYPTRNVRRSSPYGKVVEKPLTETMIEYRPVIRRKQVDDNDKDKSEDSYDDLRKAVMEYWSIMREYYKAAGEAFANQDHERAHKFMEEGHFFMKKAREADEKSAEKLLESNVEEELFVDLLDFEPKEAVRFLKVQLTSLSGIPSFKCLKARVGSDGEDAKDGFRKRMLTKFLLREDIKWTEEENGWICVILLDEIDPKKLSFANK